MQPVALELTSQEGSLPLLPPNPICTVSFAPQLPAPPLPSLGGGKFRIAGSFFQGQHAAGSNSLRGGNEQDVFSKAPKCWEGPGETTDLQSPSKEGCQ